MRAGFPVAALALVAWMAVAATPARRESESESAGESGARMDWVAELAGTMPDLSWAKDERSSRVLAGDGARHAFVERRLRRATDDLGYRYVEAIQALPPGTQSAYAIVLPGGGSPALGPVPSIRAPQLEIGRDATHTLRHPVIGQAGLSQRCRTDATGHTWCAIAISTGTDARILDYYVAAIDRKGGRYRLELSFVGDLNADGVFDLILAWDSRGGASCMAEYLFTSLETRDGWRWPMAGDSACD